MLLASYVVLVALLRRTEGMNCSVPGAVQDINCRDNLALVACST